MKRIALGIVVLWWVWVLGLMAVNPSWPLARWMYVRFWETANHWTGNEFPIPDRFR